MLVRESALTMKALRCRRQRCIIHISSRRRKRNYNVRGGWVVRLNSHSLQVAPAIEYVKIVVRETF